MPPGPTTAQEGGEVPLPSRTIEDAEHQPDRALSLLEATEPRSSTAAAAQRSPPPPPPDQLTDPEANDGHEGSPSHHDPLHPATTAEDGIPIAEGMRRVHAALLNVSEPHAVEFFNHMDGVTWGVTVYDGAYHTGVVMFRHLNPSPFQAAAFLDPRNPEGLQWVESQLEVLLSQQPQDRYQYRPRSVSQKSKGTWMFLGDLCRYIAHGTLHDPSEHLSIRHPDH